MSSSSRTDAEGAARPYASLSIGAHQVALLRDGEQAFPAMLAAIASAKSFVCLETYILRDDGTGRRFAAALMERSRAGVEVSVLYDAWGSSVGSAFLAELHGAGVRVAAFRPINLGGKGRLARIFARLLKRNHRKALVVDGRAAFMGGMNIADDYASPADGGAGWRDTQVRLEGPAVYELLHLFLQTWRRAKGAPIDEPRYAHQGRRPDPVVRVVGNELRRGRREVRKAYLQAIRAARQRILLTSSYFLPTRTLSRALRRAARRGVEVQVIVGGTTDVPAVLMAARATYHPLLVAGARILEWRGRVLHAKTAVVDGRWCTVGSTNLDTLSLQVNLEVNAVIEDERFARAMERMFEEDLAFCEEITLDWLDQRPLFEKVLSWFFLQFRRWL